MKRQLSARVSSPVFVPEAPNQVWSADFMRDALCHGTRFRTFNIIDDFNREVLVIGIDPTLRVERIIRVLDRLKADWDLLHMLRVDNGPKFLAKSLQDWGKGNCVLILSYPAGTADPECFY